ncbi:hypothetical protein JRQ81_013319 [Phrynocephalus forsythii]|uniref:Uncharacterized protein n=1 Tax=Phrynocephalus forsythii TaxID=171643 RepID=A0A9Q0XZM6_9SAUR|nr:hypothetical protein JRQ81_013319 [Phrynocephalus forsythii]
MTGIHEGKQLPGALLGGESEVEKELRGGYREVPLLDAPTLPPFSSIQDTLKQNAHQCGAVSDQIHLIIRILCCIFKNIKEMSSYLDMLSQVLSAHLPALIDLPVLHQPPSQSIGDLKWHQIQKPCSSSSERASNLISVDSLNDAAWPKKFLLSFGSPRFPSLVIRRKDSLALWDVFPTRVFRNSNVKPLLVKTSVNEINSPTVTVPNIKLKPLSWEPFSIPTILRVLSLKTVGNDPIVNEGWDSAKEKNLIISYGKLPPEEQQAILERLDRLKQRLLCQKDPFTQRSQEPRCSTSHEAFSPKGVGYSSTLPGTKSVAAYRPATPLQLGEEG